jgi:hypothetical protein
MAGCAHGVGVEVVLAGALVLDETRARVRGRAPALGFHLVRGTLADLRGPGWKQAAVDGQAATERPVRVELAQRTEHRRVRGQREVA